MRQWGVSHPGIRTSFTNITFDYEKTCVRKEGNGAFWDFYFQSPDDIKNPFKTVDVDVAEWVAAKRALVKQQGGYTATLLGIFRNREGQTLMVSTKNFFSLMVLGVAAATLPGHRPERADILHLHHLERRAWARTQHRVRRRANRRQLTTL